MKLMLLKAPIIDEQDKFISIIMYSIVKSETSTPNTVISNKFFKIAI